MSPLFPPKPFCVCSADPIPQCTELQEELRSLRARLVQVAASKKAQTNSYKSEEDRYRQVPLSPFRSSLSRHIHLP